MAGSDMSGISMPTMSVNLPLRSVLLATHDSIPEICFIIREYGILAAGAALLALAFLFNPWGVVAQRFRAAEDRRAAANLRDEVRMRRLRLALDVWYLEKQAYPEQLGQPAESGLVPRRDLRRDDGRPFAYRGGERDYRFARE